MAGQQPEIAFIQKMSPQKLHDTNVCVKGWVGLLELRAGLLELRTGLLELRAGLLELRAGLLDLRTGLFELRTGLLELKTGLELKVKVMYLRASHSLSSYRPQGHQ